MHNYPSNITRKEFEIVRTDLEMAKKKTKPRKLDLYDIFCAVLYVVKNGCQWRMLPADFPKWEIVYYYFSVWSKADGEGVSALDRALKKLVCLLRNDDLRKNKTTCAILDAQSVQNADTAEEKGYDAGKKTSVIKRHIAVDTQGLPHAVGVTTANVTDRNGAIELISANSANLSCILKFIVNGGYSGKKFAKAVKSLCGADVEFVKRNELHKFAVLPRRWVVELAFG